MNIQCILVGIVVAILLVASSSGASVSGNETNITIDSNSTNPITTVITTLTTAPITTQTTAPITTARATTEQPLTSAVLTTLANATNPTTSDSSITTAAPSTITAAPSTSTKTKSPTTKSPGRKFDGLSFMGGIILAGGLGGIVFLVVSYLRRSNRLPYANLR